MKVKKDPAVADFIDLTDPTTRALYDHYPENAKKDFVGAYLYMKYLHELISLSFSEAALAAGVGGLAPSIATAADLAPEIKEAIRTVTQGYAQSWSSRDTSVYHSKAIPLATAKQLVTQQIDVNVAVPETVLPFRMARNVVLTNPDAIAVGTCPCRAANPNTSCMPDPMEACFFLGDPYVSFLVDHNPRFRKVSHDEAVSILEDCNNRGFVSCAYFKKDMGNRLHALCNCCECCCGGIKMQNQALDGTSPFAPLIAPSGYVAEVSEECNGCEACIDKCQFHALSLNGDAGRVEVKLERCMGCGVCEGQCPPGAISMRLEPSKGSIFDLEDLKRLSA